MPTFYWVGNGCPKDGTSSTSHLWGTSEFHWNNPNNWIVAHSLHEVTMAGIAGMTGPREPNDTFKMKVEVYAIPNRVPGPGDSVYVGHYPWLDYLSTSSLLGSGDTNGVQQTNSRLFTEMDWMSNASGIARNAKAALPVLWKPYDSTTGKFRTVAVPSGVAGTSGVSINKKFYATTSITLNTSNYSGYSEWFDGTVSTNATVLSEATSIASSVRDLAFHRNGVRNGQTKWNTYNNVANLSVLPEQAYAPLLWGGCVAGTTGVTSAAGISGGSGWTWWPNASSTLNTSNPNLLAATGQALDELNIVFYSDNLMDSNGAVSVAGRVYSTATFWDPYPFKSVGDGLFGEEYNTVKDNFSKPHCQGVTGGQGYNGQPCYPCAGGITGRASNYNAIFTNKSLTAEGVRATCLFVKANKVNVKTPHEWNKYAANNPLGEMIHHADYPPVYRYSDNLQNTSIPENTSWINKQLGLITCAGSSGCQDTWGTWGAAGKNDSSKYVELRLADNWGSKTGSSESYMGTLVHAQMRFGQFNMPYGKVQELHLGIPHGSYGNEYTDGNMTILGLEGGVVTAETVKSALDNYKTYSNNDAMQLFNNTNFINRDNTNAKFGKANPFWPSSGVYFVGNDNTTDGTTRVNILNSYSVSSTILPTASIGVARIFLGLGDNLEFTGKSLTAPSNAYDYTANYGSVYVNHGYPIAVPNRNSSSFGIFQHGSMVTGDAYRASLIEAKSVGKVNNSGGTADSSVNSTRPKSAFVTSILNSQVGDMVIDNTDYIFLSPENFPISSKQKYGNKTVDRLFVKDNSNVDISQDTHGYIHFGRVLSATAGYTGSIYGGVIFQGDNNEVFYPAAGTRLWISALGGNITDNRQQSMPVAFVASNNIPGTGEMPNALVGSTVSSTSKQNPYSYIRNEIAIAKNPEVSELYDQLGLAEEDPGAIAD